MATHPQPGAARVADSSTGWFEANGSSFTLCGWLVVFACVMVAMVAKIAKQNWRKWDPRESLPSRMVFVAGAILGMIGIYLVGFFGVWLVVFLIWGGAAMILPTWRERVVIGFPLPIPILAAGAILGLIAFGVDVHPFLQKDATLRIEFAKFVGAVLVATVGIFTVYYQHRNHQQTVQANFTERFTRAVEMLGETREQKEQEGEKVVTRTVPNLEVRLGGIHALERLAGDSEKDRPAILKILCAYVRENSKRSEAEEKKAADAIDRWRVERKRNSSADLDIPPPRTDVQTAWTVIGAAIWNRAALSDIQRPPIDLRGADLRGGNLARGHLEDAMLDKAHLEGTVLRWANLDSAELEAAHLDGAELGEADLRGAQLEKAQLECAELPEANLKGADLTEANLAGANLWRANLEGATLTGTILEGAYLLEARLERSQLRHAHSRRKTDGPAPPT